MIYLVLVFIIIVGYCSLIWNIKISIFIGIIFIGILYLLKYSNNTSLINIQPNQKTFVPSNSNGLVKDKEIIDKIIENFPSSFIFNFEDYNIRSRSDHIFVNLDCINISKLNSPNAPYYVLCKTKQAFSILKNYIDPKRLRYTLFTSIDKYDPKIIKNYKKFLHIPGKSLTKGTLSLIMVWLKHPEWPSLTIIARNEHGLVDFINNILGITIPNNIICIFDFIEEEKHKTIMNECGIHLCLSTCEGFGHYINEAKSTKAVVLYTNGGSMNEFFTNGVDGLGIDCVFDGMHNDVCPKYKFLDFSLENHINFILESNNLETIGENARKTYINSNKLFETNFLNYIKGNKKIPKIIHTMWINKNLPYEDVEELEKYKIHKKTWLKNNKDFIFMYWSGKMIIELIKSHYPQYLNFYIKLSPNISKCDFARFLIINAYGGLYTDCDFYCKKNISSLLIGENYFIFEPSEHGEYLCNGFFAAVPNNDFVIGWINKMINNDPSLDVMNKTGPSGLLTYYKQTQHKILIGNVCDVLSITKDNSISKTCKIYNGYVGTIWTDGSGWTNEPIFTGHKIIKNKYNNNDLIWETKGILNENETYDEKLIQNQNFVIFNLYALSIFLSDLFKNKEIYIIGNNKNKCDAVERTSIINGLSNLKVIYKPQNTKTGIYNNKSFLEEI